MPFSCSVMLYLALELAFMERVFMLLSFWKKNSYNAAFAIKSFSIKAMEEIMDCLNKKQRMVWVGYP